MIDISTDGTDRGVSPTVGFVLLIMITIMAAGVLLLTGGLALSGVQQSAQASQAETAMSQFDLKAARVAIGSSPRQQIQIDNTGLGQLTTDTDAGRVVVRTSNGTESETIVNTTLGRFEYATGDVSVAYQGGGVWRHQDGRTVMISPPEYHYRDQTLTFPLVRLTGDSWTSSSSTPLLIEKDGTRILYPNNTTQGPLTGGSVRIEITSKYHRGWNTFLESRTEGSVHHDPANQTVWVNLTVPMTESFDTGLTATSDDTNAVKSNGPGGFEGPVTTGATRPSASPRIESKIAECENTGCTSISGAVADGTLENGTYYSDVGRDLPATTYDTSDGDINIVVDGDLEFSGGDSHTVTGSGSVTFYVKGDVAISGSTGMNTGGDPANLIIVVHSDASAVSVNGNAQFTGLIYAPSAALSINGGGPPWNDNIVGAAVVETATANGNANLVFSSTPNYELQFETMTDINYLYISENRINTST